MSFLDDLDRGLLDLIFPRDCAVTQEPMDEGERLHLSDAGLALLPRIFDPRCFTCGHPFDGWLEGDRTCPHCLDLHPAFHRALCAFRAQGPVRHIIHRIKYEKSPYLADDLVAAAIQDTAFHRHLAGSHLIPVPLHRNRYRTRGYNQAERIVRLLAQKIPGCSWSPALHKKHLTISQTQLGREERRRNVAEAFSVNPNYPIRPDIRYVVIDDVLTTGSTLHACAKTLRDAGALWVDAAALAHG